MVRAAAALCGVALLVVQCVGATQRAPHLRRADEAAASTTDDASAPPVVVPIDGSRNDCYDKPEICNLTEYCELSAAISGNASSPPSGQCVSYPTSPDCYRFPGACAEDEWCQLEDRQSWAVSDNVTRGRCVGYQSMCMACTRTAAETTATGMGVSVEESPSVGLAGALSFAHLPGRIGDAIGGDSGMYGEYLERQTRCAPGLACIGDLIPSLPSTCVTSRGADTTAGPPNRHMLLDWQQRMFRMGARTYSSPQAGRGLADQESQGVSREALQQGVNDLFEALWPTAALGAWPGAQEMHNDGPTAPLCCQWDNYTESLTSFQASHGSASWRNPMHPDEPDTGNAPPCVFCLYDGAYNDENPTIWMIIHALTFNLPETVSEGQYSALRALPLFLREHLSCSLCRSHVKEHLIELGVPTSRKGFDWAFFFWRAHNYVNEQSEVTRCGDMDCQWGAWNSPSPKFLCAGVYRYPWFLEWEKAATQWRIPRVNPHSSDDATADGAAEGAGARRSGRPLALGFREM